MIDRVGPFDVLREVGRGGMGVVYLARDTRLDREVAIKALPEHLASDPARLARFEREARTLAGLSHPNLAGIYGVEEQDGARYLVLEYVDGETLADRLDRGPLPADEAVEYAVQIAAGMEAAHEAGVIHRDLKPANIKITPDGVAKVLDFGLARADEGGQSSTGALDSPTMTQPTPQHSPTIEGAILGTAAYMSPEQARGRRVDKRTDIWSFGVLLYEMLVGASPFQGETATDSIGAVLHKDFALDSLPADTPANVRRVLERCLVRDKSERYRDIGDVRVELSRVEPASHAAPAVAPLSTVPLVAVFSAIVLGLVGALMFVLLRPPAADERGADAMAPRIRAVQRLTDFEDIEQHPTISPDGKSIAYAAVDGGDTDIFLLRVGGSNPINLTADSPANDFDPAFSPDGEQIAFASTRGSGGVYVMGATGENPRRIAPEGFDPAWSPDGATLACCTAPARNAFGRGSFGEIFLVDVESRDLTWLRATQDDVPGQQIPHDAVAPAWSPDGSRIVYWSMEAGQRDLYWMSAAGGARHRMTNDPATDWDPVWSPDGASVIFLSDRGGTRGLWRIELSPDGTPGVPIAMMPGPVQVEEFAMTPNGERFVVGTREERGELGRVSFDAETLTFGGDSESLYTSAWSLFDLDISEDGRWFTHRVAGDAGDDIVVVDLQATTRRTLLRDRFRDRRPQFITHDGSRLSYYSNRSGEYAVWTMNRDGTDQAILIEAEGVGLSTPTWKRDMSALATHQMPLGTLIYSFNEDGTLADEPPIVIDNFHNPIVWSHDGSRVLGFSELQEGLLTIAVLVPDTGEISFVFQTDSQTVEAAADIRWVTWIDATRLISWDFESNQLFIVDSTTGESEQIDAPFQEPAAFFKGMGDTLYYVRNSLNGDLWLVEIGADSNDPEP